MFDFLNRGRRSGRTLDAERMFPIIASFDGILMNRKGYLTLGFELALPAAYTVSDGTYAEIQRSWVNAVSSVPDWTMIHRQDVFLDDAFEPLYSGEFLHDCAEKHYEGRTAPVHRSFLYLTLVSEGMAKMPVSASGIYGNSIRAAVPGVSQFARLVDVADKFVKTLQSGGYISARRLTDADYFGEDDAPGLIQQVMMLGDGGPCISDIEMDHEWVRAHGRYAFSYSIGEADLLPSEVDTTSRVRELSYEDYGIYLSYASKLGVELPLEHIVNQYILVPSQLFINAELDRNRRQMTSGSSSNDNRLHAADINEYLDDVVTQSLRSVKSHVNVIAWAESSRAADVSSTVQAALNAMSVSAASYNIHDTPVLWYAGIPGNCTDLGAEHLMTMEMRSSLALGIYETYDRDLPGGTFRLTDRIRHTPVTLDLQEVAYRSGLISDYNQCIIGPTGSGKSFYMCNFLHQSYCAGKHVFLLDNGDSYEGLAALVREQSGGADGQYYAWNPERPFRFNPLADYRRWSMVHEDYGDIDREAEGSAVFGSDTKNNGYLFFVTLLKTLWQPRGGWRTEMTTYLEQMVADFISAWAPSRGNPVFDDFYRYVGDTLKPLIDPVWGTGATGEAVKLRKTDPSQKYMVGYTEITPEIFDVDAFLSAMKPFSRDGAYGFIFDVQNPEDLLSSRFVIYEVKGLMDQDEMVYTLCTLCIMHLFENKMRDVDALKLMVIEEAWKLLGKTSMALYLTGLWRTARKYKTSATVVTQTVHDLSDDGVIKTAIIENSSIKVLLDQRKNQNNFSATKAVVGLSDNDCSLVMSMNRSLDPRYGTYKEVFIKLGGHPGMVYATELSREQCLAFESEKPKKAPMLDLARRLSSIRAAILQMTGVKLPEDYDYTGRGAA